MPSTQALSVKGEVVKVRECEEEGRESGGHMSICQAKCLTPNFIKLIRERLRLMGNQEGKGLQCIRG